jgi:hypothetical protein
MATNCDNQNGSQMVGIPFDDFFLNLSPVESVTLSGNCPWHMGEALQAF